MAFETDDAVDDIVCTMSDGTKLYVQAKRKCGNDNSFRAAIGQWVSQLPALASGDRVAIAYEQATGDIAHFASALHQKRSGGTLSSGELKAVAAFTAATPLGTSDEDVAELIARGYAWKVSASSATDIGFQLIASMLENVVVAANQGTAATHILLSKLHSEAGSASASSLEDWWSGLNIDEFDLIANGTGANAQRLTARRDVLNRYRANLGACRDRIEFSLLAEDIPPLNFQNLIGTIRASSDGSDADRGEVELAHVVRRQKRLVLCGLPGSGKTTAVDQLAAAWSADRRAPLPVLVRLSRIYPRIRRSKDCTMQVLVEDATFGASFHDRPLLAEWLERELVDGFCVLILDGLDECGSGAAAVVDGLISVLGQISADTGVVLTTRSSGLPAAKKLRLPVWNLLPPNRAEHTQRAILEHVGRERTKDNKDFDKWLNNRVPKMSALQNEHRELTKVPLLSTLVTLLVASDEVVAVKISSAEILERAVTGSVAQWERQRDVGLLDSDDATGVLDVQMLLVGFTVIGHSIAGSNEATWAEAVTAVEGSLQRDWQRPPREASVIAVKILHFWDDRLGVFVKEANGRMVARSKVFIDLADSLWVAEQEDDGRRIWLKRRLSDPNSFNAFKLGLAKYPILADLGLSSIVEPDMRSRLVRWICDAADGVDLSSSAIDLILDELLNSGQVESRKPPVQHGDSVDFVGVWGDEARAARDGVVWPFVRRACMLSVSNTARSKRDQVAALVQHDPERRILARGLAALSDSINDNRKLSDAERLDVQTMLRAPLPEPRRGHRETTGHKFTVTGVPLLSGLSEGAERAVRFLGEMESVDAEAVAEVSHRSSMSLAMRIDSELIRLGYPTKNFAKPSIDFSRWKDSDGRWLTDHFMVAIAEIADPGEGSSADAWWCREVFSLFEAMDVAEQVAGTMEAAVATENRPLLIALARVYASIRNISAPQVAFQIASAVDTNEEALHELLILALTEVADQNTDGGKFVVLSDADKEAALKGLRSTCSWLGQKSCELLAHTTDANAAAVLVNELADLDPRARYWTAAAACILTDDLPTIAQALYGRDARSRCALAMIVSVDESIDTEAAASIRDILRSDRDLTVRLVAGGTEDLPVPPDVWTCRGCDFENVFSANSCSNCNGAKPTIASTL